MLILFDHGAPRSIARFLVEHTVTQAKARGWDQLSNGKLLQAAEEAGFDVLLTTDKNIRYQQTLKGRRIAIVVLGNPQRPAVHRHIDRVVAAVNAATPRLVGEVIQKPQSSGDRRFPHIQGMVYFSFRTIETFDEQTQKYRPFWLPAQVRGDAVEEVKRFQDDLKQGWCQYIERMSGVPVVSHHRETGWPDA
jgi:hypothetical protein